MYNLTLYINFILINPILITSYEEYGYKMLIDNDIIVRLDKDQDPPPEGTKGEAYINTPITPITIYKLYRLNIYILIIPTYII